MPSYQELLERKAELDAQIEAARQTEVAEVIAQVRQLVEQYGLTAEDLGLASRRGHKSAGQRKLPPLYRDPKSGATWSGRGRVPRWMGKNRDRYLIA
ncbi:H-NS histone family protein [Ralstonia solanacearum]|uniref:H-NS histone family protein n=1 Tax=Ralstonia solanacearum TaxID=305 RepID=UPI0005067B06|nr:H-NS histone family protein [Ralstonia solanacearum]AMP72636.1 DNA-binding protein [Ralstonia solanacearum]KFX76795.1 DNA-binding protein [Ralstonia solanacearum]MCL9842416.1 H-NS histone family protein [Ralstonia solanacearum]MDB0534512.1 H-NS histone family protein [Ralstonia solanacearum]MDB0539308.1 H-NS histone family protein [Ralstonia solanacearum]